MKRDLSLCRELLLKLEATIHRPMATYHFPYGEPEVEGSPSDIISYNLALMIEAGFFSGRPQMAGDGGLVCSGISWAGHDYLDAVRDPEVWRKTKDGAKSVGGLTFGLVKDLAVAIVKGEITAKLGIHL